jgi:ubiquinone/menaquinone biosynthesis C-methylase UbiE
MSPAHAPFTPALAYDFLTPAFDLTTAMLGFGASFAEGVAELAAVLPEEAVLDLGYGTGRLLVALVKRQPAARYVGVDPDPRVEAIARRRLDVVASGEVELRHGYAQDLPFPAESFDLVVSTLVFHHLPDNTKRAALAQVGRVLRPHGRFLLVDFGQPQTVMSRTLLTLGSLFDGRANMRANLGCRLPLMLHEAGFQVAELRPPHRAVRYLLAKPRSTVTQYPPGV